MADVYVLASYCDQGKIITALALERYLKEQGKKVACLQKIKGQSDVGLYLKNGCFQYSLPLEAAKNRESLEQWMPKGFDAYIIAISTAYSPIGAAFLDLFAEYNEIIPEDWKNNWTDSIEKLVKPYSTDPKIIAFWEETRKKIHLEKKVQPVITGVSTPLDDPCVDKNTILHNPEKLRTDSFEPMMEFPKSNKKVIAVGAFPGEYWDFFPNLMWYDYDYHKFVQDLRLEKYDLAIIGECSNKNLKLPDKPENKNAICYQPSVFLHECGSDEKFRSGRDLHSVYRTIKEKPVGTPLQENGFSYRDYCNRFWAFQTYPGADIVQQKDNVVYCNGWVLPQYLMKEGLLEV
jgi:hypothetical protein